MKQTLYMYIYYTHGHVALHCVCFVVSIIIFYHENVHCYKCIIKLQKAIDYI